MSEITSMRGTHATSRPSILIDPDVGPISRLIGRSVVKLLKAERPKVTKISPVRMSKVALKTPTAQAVLEPSLALLLPAGRLVFCRPFAEILKTFLILILTDRSFAERSLSVIKAILSLGPAPEAGRSPFLL